MPAEVTTSLADLGAIQHAAYAVQLALGGVFLLSAVPKLRRPAEFRATVAGYRVLPARAVAVAAGGLIAVESFLAFAFLSGWLVVAAVPMGAVALALFGSVTYVNLRRGRDVPCGCFGNAGERISGRSLTRLGLLAAALVAYAVAVASPDAAPASPGWLAAHSGSVPAYVVEIASLSTFFVVLATWALGHRELLAVIRGPRGVKLT
jgi:hypothetical protein